VGKKRKRTAEAEEKKEEDWTRQEAAVGMLNELVRDMREIKGIMREWLDFEKEKERKREERRELEAMTEESGTEAEGSGKVREPVGDRMEE
jgi:hypothetical protein